MQILAEMERRPSIGGEWSGLTFLTCDSGGAFCSSAMGDLPKACSLIGRKTHFWFRLGSQCWDGNRKQKGPFKSGTLALGPEQNMALMTCMVTQSSSHEGGSADGQFICRQLEDRLSPEQH